VSRKLFFLLIVAALVLSGCGPSQQRREQDRAEIERLLDAYGRALAEAYRSGSAEALREVATERELTRVHKQIEELAGGGRRLDAQPVSRAIQSVDFNRNTASVTATEVWNLRVVATGSETVLSESPAQENQILYSLTREGGRWWILSRILARSSED